ncbi:zinc finger BED domain-containing protein DAYSLEEPER-like [Nicotiana tomentosiformis]|uniref:zinc finger BED domain-containing protein DAYSLEEPER-like n=1 Tax=Nicotiana tomentosiformis TaxID=4098 RepID=UPI00388C8657
MDDDDEGLDGFNIWSTFSTTQTSSRNINELQFYLQKQKEPRIKEFSPLGWWHENEKQFLILSAMAMDMLNVLISTVALESAFSQARQQLGDTRHSLGSNALEVLVCFRGWIRSERKNQGREDVDRAEDEELENILTHGNPSEFNTPEDIQEVHTLQKSSI